MWGIVGVCGKGRVLGVTGISKKAKIITWVFFLYFSVSFEYF